MKNRLIAFLTVLTMLTILASGCGQTTTPATTSAASGTSSVSTDSNLNLTGYPIVKEKVTLTAMASRNPAVLAPYAENELAAYLEDLTNVHFEFIDVDFNSWTEKLTLALASGDLPDIIMKNSLTSTQLLTNYQQGKFLDVRPYLSQYAPNLSKIMKDRPEVLRAITLPDDAIASFPGFQLPGAPGIPNCPTTCFMINTKWLDKLKIDMPTNTESLYQALKAFKTMDPNGNNKADEIPLSPLYGIGGLRDMSNFFGVMFGRNYCYVTPEDKVVYTPMTDQYKECLKWEAKLYKEGLLDKDVFTQNNQQVLAKGSGEVELLGSSISSGSFIFAGEVRDVDFSTVIIADKQGNKVWSNRDPVVPSVYTITSNCKNPEVAVRWVDMFYTQEGGQLMWMGVKDVNYKVTTDGRWNWILKDKETVTQLRGRATLQPGGFYPGYVPDLWLSTSDKVETVAINQRAVMAKAPAGLLRVPFPIYYLERDTDKELTTIATDVNSYVDQMMARFVTGDADIDAEWDNYIATLKKMNAPRLLEIMTKAYEDSKK